MNAVIVADLEVGPSVPHGRPWTIMYIDRIHVIIST